MRAGIAGGPCPHIRGKSGQNYAAAMRSFEIALYHSCVDAGDGMGWTCVRCDKRFEDKHNPWRTRKFCSRACCQAHQSRPPLEYACAYCKKTFMSRDRRRGMNLKHFCSRVCQYKGQDYLRKNFNEPLSAHPRWKGGKWTSKTDGYVYLTVAADFPGAVKHGKSHYIQEHIKVIQDALGKILRDDETVHHRNGIRDDNALGNLELRSGNHGVGATAYTEDVNRLIVELAKARNRTVVAYEYLPNQSDC